MATGDKHIIYAKPFLWAVIFGVLLYQDALARFFSPISYFDEILAILFFLYFILHSSKKMDKKQLSILGLVSAILLIGFMGNLKSEVLTSIKNIVWDAFNIFKFVMAISGALLYFENLKNKRYLMKYLNSIVRLSVILASLFMMLNLVADIGMHTDYRYGIRAYNFIFGRVGGFYSACVIWLIILKANQIYKVNNRIFIYLTLLNMCATLRSRAIAFVLVYVILNYLIFVKNDKKFNYWYFVPIVLLLFFTAKDQLLYYFSGERARNVLLKYGIITAKRFFPIGSGFSTYGTAVARDTYSQLYLDYGFSSVWGLSKDNTDFLTDNYWPAVLGEFGIIGTLVMAYMHVSLFKFLMKFVNNRHSKLCLWFAYATLMISSIASSSFFACTQLMIFVSLIVNLKEEKVYG